MTKPGRGWRAGRKGAIAGLPGPRLAGTRHAIAHAKLTPLADPDYNPYPSDRELTRELEAKLNFWRENLRVTDRVC